ncbi:MAG: glycoside hydrolase [Candidatus Helarchaeota archaeon]|nr:glycoside hydrolase [Candidatus Helarchaeota archaeon]
MKFAELNIKQKTFIQMVIAGVIAVLWSFVLPLQWQPLQAVIGDVFGAESGVALGALSSWFFGFAIAWFIFRDNAIINNLMMYSLLPLGVILGLEVAFYLLFWDYVHLLPFVVDLYILWKKRGTLRKDYLIYSTGIFTAWVYLSYFLGIAYSNIPLYMFLLGMVIYPLVMLAIAFWVPRGAVRVPRGLIRKVLKGVLIGLWIFGAFFGSVLLFWYLRPNSAIVDKTLVLDSWVAVTEQHNSNTDLTFWNGSFYLIHDRRPYHLPSPEARLIVWKSVDARNWTKVTEFSVPGEDIRDPKFAIIGSRLFMYALKNVGVLATPYQTVYTYTEDGQNWQPFQEIALSGWLFWRPKTNDNSTWYVPAYWHEHGQSILLNSTDGINWNVVATIYLGEATDETDIEFLPDGRLLATARLEGTEDNMFGSSNGSTLIATAPYPYHNWSSYVKSQETRLDGPVLFSYENTTYAIGRRQLGPRTVFTELGSIFSRKRTSIFLVREEGLFYLTDLLSAGDTSYAGVALNGTELYVSYYTSDITKDYPWILGMIADSDIRMAKVNLTALAARANLF